MKDIWSKFRLKPRDMVDAYVYLIADASLHGQSDLQQLATVELPAFSEMEIATLVNLNLDMVAPSDPKTAFSDWVDAWQDGLFFAMLACGTSAINPLWARVILPARDSARLMFFECLISAMAQGDAKATEFEALALDIDKLDWMDLFETADVAAWMKPLVTQAPMRAQPLIKALEEKWFSIGLGDDLHDDDFTLFSWASAAVFASMWAPVYRSMFKNTLRETAVGYFAVPVDMDDPSDMPVHGVSRLEKIGCRMGAILVLLDEDTANADLLEMCRSFVDSPAGDTKKSWEQWLPLADKKLPNALAALQASGLTD